MSKIGHIGKLTPNAILADYLQEVEEIKSIIVIVQYKDDKLPLVSWSNMEIREAVYAERVLRRVIDLEMSGGTKDEPPSGA